MGDHNAVDIAQAVHLQVLRDVGLCQPDLLYEWGRPMPGGDVGEGVPSCNSLASITHTAVGHRPSDASGQPGAESGSRCAERIQWPWEIPKTVVKQHL